MGRVEGLFTYKGRLFMDVRRYLVRVEVARVTPIRGRVLVNTFLANYFKFNCVAQGFRRYDISFCARRLLIGFLTGGEGGTLPRVTDKGVRRFKIVTVR